jgi:hypothetical protein
MTRVREWASAVRNRRVTTWATKRPHNQQFCIAVRVWFCIRTYAVRFSFGFSPWIFWLFFPVTSAKSRDSAFKYTATYTFQILINSLFIITILSRLMLCTFYKMAGACLLTLDSVSSRFTGGDSLSALKYRCLLRLVPFHALLVAPPVHRCNRG